MKVDICPALILTYMDTGNGQRSFVQNQKKSDSKSLPRHDRMGKQTISHDCALVRTSTAISLLFTVVVLFLNSFNRWGPCKEINRFKLNIFLIALFLTRIT